MDISKPIQKAWTKQKFTILTNLHPFDSVYTHNQSLEDAWP